MKLSRKLSASFPSLSVSLSLRVSVLVCYLIAVAVCDDDDDDDEESDIWLLDAAIKGAAAADITQTISIQFKNVLPTLRRTQ